MDLFKIRVREYLLKILEAPTKCGCCNQCELATNPYHKSNPEGYFCEFNRIATKDFTRPTTFGCTEFIQKK